MSAWLEYKTNALDERIKKLEEALAKRDLWAGVDKLALKPGEVLVIKTGADITPEEMEQVADKLSEHCGFTVKVLLLDRDTEIAVLGEESQG